ncbi:MAG: cytochrome c biogenesis protein CcsA [Betaproteobacteria bacterium]|nr:cytochrome c biogenesis protein CcsA [Betaproteobacteria bacterium]
MTAELQLLWLALMFYTLAGSTAIGATVLAKRPERIILAVIMIGLAAHAVSLGLRWERLGHGPFITLFEILSSNVWSLLTIYALAYWRVPAVRPAAVVVMPILFVMMAWLLVTSSAAGHFPPTYRTVWLYVHMLFGKVFLGTVLIAVGVAGLILLRHAGIVGARLAQLPDSVRLENLAFRFIMVGFVFESLMLVAGAIWAQDAWGRYWAWDPLETWAFATWLLLAFFIHLRVTVKLKPYHSAALIMAVFVLAFLTFFGVPFVSTAPHKGAV